MKQGRPTKYSAKDDARIIEGAEVNESLDDTARAIGRTMAAVASRVSYLRTLGVQVPFRSRNGKGPLQTLPQLKNVLPSRARARGYTTRPCLCCERPFQSSGSMHRLCNYCRHSNPSPYAP